MMADESTSRDLEREASEMRARSGRPSGRAHFLGCIVTRLTLIRAALLLFLFSLTVSVVLTWVVRPMMGRYEALGGEGYDGYLELGVNLARGNGFVFEPGGHKVFHRPPLYPALLVPAAWMSEPAQRLYVAVLNAALLAVASLAVFHIGKRLFNAQVGWVAWALFALNPPIIATAKNAVSAISQATAYALMLYCWLLLYQAAKARSPITLRLKLAVIASTLAGMMCHGTMLAAAAFLIASFAVWAVLTRRWPVVGSVLLIAVMLVALVSPWTLRNHRVTGMWIPIAGNPGLAYFAGNAHWGITQPATASPHESTYAPLLRHAGISEPAEAAVKFYGFTSPRLEKIANERMKEHLRMHPGPFLHKVFLNAVEYYFPIIYHLVPPEGAVIAGMPLADRLKSNAALRDFAWSSYSGVMLLLAFFGTVTMLKNRPTRYAAICLLVAWAAYAAPYFPFLTFVGNSPYTFGTFPILSLLAAPWLVTKFAPSLSFLHGYSAPR